MGRVYAVMDIAEAESLIMALLLKQHKVINQLKSMMQSSSRQPGG